MRNGTRFDVAIFLRRSRRRRDSGAGREDLGVRARPGLDREMLYLLVPRGSISALSHREASELIERLVELGARRVAAAQPKAAERRPIRTRRRRSSGTSSTSFSDAWVGSALRRAFAAF